MIDFELLSVLQKDADIRNEETIDNLRCRVSNTITELNNEIAWEDCRPEGFDVDEAKTEVATFEMFDKWLRLQDYINRKLFPRFMRDVDVFCRDYTGRYDLHDLFNNIQEAVADVMCAYDREEDISDEVDAETYRILGLLIEYGFVPSPSEV